MKKLILLLLVLFGCSQSKIEYSDWQTERFLVWAIVHEPNSKPMAILNSFRGGKFIEIKVPAGDFQEGQQLTLTYRKITKTICTDKNCTLEESYEVK